MLRAENCRSPILEVIVSSVADALEAERGGADRLEVVRDLDRGGLTPDLNLVRSIRRTVSLPLRVMLRENEDYSVPEGKDFGRVCATALELEQIGVDGVVVGYLRNGRVEMEKMLELMNSVPRLGATLHHAFDDSESPLDTMAALKKSGRIDRILSSGGPGTISERAVRLERYQRQALGDIIILAGGGMDEEAIHFLCTRTGIREFHVGRAARSPHNSSGAVRSELVERLRRIVSEDRKNIGTVRLSWGANG